MRDLVVVGVPIDSYGTQDTGKGAAVDVQPRWIRFQDRKGARAVFAADLEVNNLAGATDVRLFACDLARARCSRSPAGPGERFPHHGGELSPVTRRGSSLLTES